MNAKTAPWVLLAATAIFAFDNLILKMVPKDFTPLETILFSLVVAAPIVTILFRKSIMKLPDVRTMLELFVVAGLYFLYNVLNMQSLRFLSVDTATFYFSTSIVMVPVIDLFFGYKLRSETAIGIAVTMGGIWVISMGAMTHNETGIALSLIAAFVRSLYLIAQNRIVRKVDSKESVVFLMWFSLLLCFLTTVIWEPDKLLYNDYSIQNFWPVITFGLTSLVMATSMYIIAQEHMSPTSVVVMASMQMVFTMIIGVIIPASTGYHEDVTLQMALGALLIIIGNLLINVGWEKMVETVRKWVDKS